MATLKQACRLRNAEKKSNECTLLHCAALISHQNFNSLVRKYGDNSMKFSDVLGRGEFIIIIIYSRQEMHIKSTNISTSSADNKGQLRTPSLTNNNSSKNIVVIFRIYQIMISSNGSIMSDRKS